MIRLGDIATFRNGLNYNSDSHGKGCLLIGVSDFGNLNAPDYSTIGEINPEGIAGEDDYLRSGDILFVRSNGNKNLVGRSLFINKSIIALYSGFCIRTRITSNQIIPRFFAYYTKSQTFKKYISSADGTNINNLNQGILGDVKIPAFSISDQKRIVAVLSALDDKLELNNRINAELEQMAKTLYDYWFVQFDFPNSEGKPYKSSVGKMVYDEVLRREIPEGWEVRILDNCIDKIIDYRGKTPKKLNSDWSTDPNDTIALSAKHVKNGKLVNLEEANRVDDKLLKSWMRDELRQGDILLTSEAPCGEFFYLVGETHFCLSQRLFAIRANLEIIHSAYLYYELSAGNGYSQILGKVSGSTVFGIRQDELRTVNILVPKKELQQKFSAKISLLYDKIRNNDYQNRQLSSLRDWLLPMLMNGQVSVGEIKENMEEILDKQVEPVRHEARQMHLFA